MPISSSAATIEKKKAFRLQHQTKSIDHNVPQHEEKTLLNIAPALPLKDKRNLYVRSHSTLNASSLSKAYNVSVPCDPVNLQTLSNGSVHVSRLQEEKEAQPDRISLDRRGLTVIPMIDGEPRLRLLSLQHNLVSSLETLKKQQFPSLVFLDIYDNQLEQIQHLDILENLRVLLMGKNRIKKIEGLENLKKIEVLDLHGNQITQVGGLTTLSELKVLNLAGNQIRIIGSKDLLGLQSLQELNIRRNKLKKLLGFGDTPNLLKLFISNNDLQSVEDISSLAKSTNIKELSIDNNPISQGGDCVSFLVSYLPHLMKLNTMQITEQVRKAAMAWRRNKEVTNKAFMDLTSDVSLNYRREEVISNARTNWEFLRSQTKCLTNTVNSVDKTLKNLQPDSDIILTSLAKPNANTPPRIVKSKTFGSIATKVPVLLEKKLKLTRTNSQDTENSQNTSSSNSGIEFFKLPPILVPIINKIEQKSGEQSKEGSVSSIGANVDSSISSLASGSEAVESSSSSSSSSKDSDSESEAVEEDKLEENREVVDIEEIPTSKSLELTVEPIDYQSVIKSTPTETSSNLSVATTMSNVSLPSNSSGSDNTGSSKSAVRSIRSAVHGKSIPPKCVIRAATAKVKKQSSPALPKDREQGGDYLIEISGRHLNVYGQGALRFIDKPWNPSKAHEVNMVKFNYVNFNSLVGLLAKLKQRFPNVDSLTFKDTNITCLGQINALAEVQGLRLLHIDAEGNALCEKSWQSYAIYRLAHWGLKVLNDREISEEDIKQANDEYQGLSDLVLWSLPDVLLQPLLVRLRIDVNHGVTEQNAKKWLMDADPELRSVVCKEALQWKKGAVSQEDSAMRQKAKQHISGLLDEMTNAVRKLNLLEQEWPKILHEFVNNTLSDYSQLDVYMKRKMQELNK